MQTFLRWFSMILPLLFSLCSHSLISRFLWVRAHIFRRALLFSIPSYTNRLKQVRDLLAKFQVPEDYTWQWHQQQQVVYIRVTPTASCKYCRCYIGSTGLSLMERESSRRRKFIQYSRGRLAYFEPALKVWYKERSFYSTISLVLFANDDDHDRLAREAALIRTFRPELNHPWVTQVLRRFHLHERTFTLPASNTGQRFIKRTLRFMQNHQRLDIQSFRADCAIFLSLYRLGSNSLHKFRESRILRSHLTSLPQLYLRQRLVQQLDEPWRTRASQQLRLILRFRGGDVPPTNIPLRLPPLAHDLTSAVRNQIRRIICSARVNFPPLHLPSTSFIEVKAMPWARTVFNFRSFLQTWKPRRPAKCICEAWQNARGAVNPTGHVFGHVRLLFPLSSLASLNLHDTTFMSASRWRQHALSEVRRWCSRWKLPSDVLLDWEKWVDVQLTLHAEALERPAFDRARDVLKVVKRLTGFVITPADHFPYTAHVACPFAFHALMDRTFLDLEVFQQCTVGMGHILSNLRSQFRAEPLWNRRYSWAVQWDRALPRARLLPKPSKAFQKARPVIACDLCWHSRLTIFLAKALFQLMSHCFPETSTYNVTSTLTAMRMMWTHMQQDSDSGELIQQDLIGFFNSVPHVRIIESLRYLLHLSQLSTGQAWQDQQLQVSTQNKWPIFRGKRAFGRHPTRTLWLADLPALTQFLLDSSYFTCGRYTFRQIQGASMGSAVAPVLCTLVANTTEFILLKNFRECLLTSGMLTGFRYADNRAFLLSSFSRYNDWRLLCLNLGFYGEPILLEHVSGEELLGTICSVPQKTITVRQPTDATQLRTLSSAGRGSYVLSGFRARVLLIMRLARPLVMVRPQVEDLIEIYCGRGFARKNLVQIARPLLRGMGIRL